MSLPNIVLAPFACAYDLFGIGYRGRVVEVLLEHVSDQGSRHSMVTINFIMDITQQTLPLFDGDTAL